MLPPTHYVRGGATRAYERDDHYHYHYKLFDKIEI